MDAKPQRPSRLYVRPDCVFCDEAEIWLSARGLAYHLIDVDSDPALSAAHGLAIPVLIDDRGQVHRWPFDESDLQSERQE